MKRVISLHITALSLLLMGGVLSSVAVAQTLSPSVCEQFATGGAVTTINDGGTDYCVHTFTNIGTSTFEVKRSSGLEVEYLVVGGGGGGGGVGRRGGGGGGGAGGYRSNIPGEGSEPALTVGAGSHPITVGAGGGENISGDDSAFGPVIALGGGRGAAVGSDAEDGGSGGGGGRGNTVTAAGTGTPGQGNDGGAGNGNDLPRSGGGGGGAATAGSDAGATTGGDGGDGAASSITGTSTVYAGGGGGGVSSDAGTASGVGGAGGGGNGALGGDGDDGVANTGGGGGGAGGTGHTPGPSGGNGGSGIVIVRYQVPIYVWAGGTNGNERDWFTASNWLGADNPDVPEGSVDLPITIPGTSQAPNQPVVGSSNPDLDIRGTLTLEKTASLTIEDNAVFQISDNATVTTEGSDAAQARIVLESGARYLNLSDQTPLLEVQRKLTGVRGWRMIASPVATDYGEFTNEIETQGFPKADLPEANPGNPDTFTPNFMWWDETDAGTTLQGWRTLNYDENGAHSTALSNIDVPSGRGHFYFNFDGAGRQDDNSESYNDHLPLTLKATGIEPNLAGGAFAFSGITFTVRDTTDQDTGEEATYIGRVEADKGWNLVGNPTASALDWSAGSGWTKTNIGNAIYVWDPSANGGAGDYLVSNGSTGTLPDNRIAPYQAFWVQASAANPVLSFTNEAKSNQPTQLIGGNTSSSKRVASDATSAGPQAGSTRNEQKAATIEFILTSQESGMVARSYVQLMEEARLGLDPWDAFRLEPPSESWFTLHTQAQYADAAPMMIQALPADISNKSLDLVIDGRVDDTRLSGRMDLEWRLDDPSLFGHHVLLIDHKTKTMIDLESLDGYTFTLHSNDMAKMTVASARSSSQDTIKTEQSSLMPQLPETPVSMYREMNPTEKISSVSLKTSGPYQHSRFSLVISEDKIETYIPLDMELNQNYPNPFNSTTNIQFSLPEESVIDLAVFDVLGRRVSTLATGSFEAGSHRVQWDTGSLASGVYLYRLSSSNGVVLSRTMTLIK